MADLKRWPMALNQPGYEYPAEMFRAEHHDATSGGNGVGAPTALKVTAQAAPDGTVSILPGGATIKSTYAGADGQSYHARNFQPFTLTVPPTGSSSGGRTDLIILRVCDPQYDTHPDHGGGEISAEDAANLDFWWFELLQGKDRNTSLSYPHVKLAEIVRPANVTVVSNSHIRDLRELASPKTHSIVITDQHGTSAPGDMGENNGWWFTAFTQHIVVPEWCNQFIIQAQAAGMYWTGGYGFGDFSINADGIGSNENTVRWRFSGADSQGSVDTHTTAVGSFDPSQRGRPKAIAYRFRNNTSSADGSRIRPTTTTRFTLNVTFLQGVE